MYNSWLNSGYRCTSCGNLHLVDYGNDYTNSNDECNYDFSYIYSDI